MDSFGQLKPLLHMGCNQYERVASGRAFDPPPMVADGHTLGLSYDRRTSGKPGFHSEWLMPLVVDVIISDEKIRR